MNEMKIEWKELPVNAEGMKEFPVPFSKWLRGTGEGRLVDNGGSGRQCCLGCAGTAMGVPISVQAGMAMPHWVIDNLLEDGLVVPTDYLGLGGKEADWCVLDSIACANDNRGFSDEERMQKLTELFAKIGYKPVFINDEE